MSSGPKAPRKLGRYALHGELASGGMAAVHLAKLRGAVGFSRLVAIKCIHPHFARDADFVAMFLDEARLASRIRHANVVAPLDVVSEQGELFMVMEYVEGESLGQLLKSARLAGEAVSLPIALAIMGDVLHGLHAVHEARDEQGQPLHIVHRDVTPQNILIGADGVARIADFGVAKAVNRLHTTRSGHAKGKLGYMSPEQVQGRPVTPRSDVYAAGVTLWEICAGRRMLEGDSEGELLMKAISAEIPRLDALVPGLSPELGQAVAQATARDPAGRFASALAFAEALEQVGGAASARQVGAWVQRLAAPALERRRVLASELDAAVPRGSSEPPTRITKMEPEQPESTQHAVAAESRPSPPGQGRSRAALALGVGGVAALVAAWMLTNRPAPAPSPAEQRPAASFVSSPPPAPPAVAVVSAEISPTAPAVSAPAAASASARQTAKKSRRTPPDAGVSDDLLGRF